MSPTTAQHVRDDLGADVDLVLDGGPCAVGVESTIVDLSGPRTGRAARRRRRRSGARSIAQGPIARRTGGEVAAPGTLASHYAPDARVELVAAADLEAHAARLRAEGIVVGILEPPADPAEYAHVLYERLRELDRRGVDVILAVAPTDTEGIGAAVADRLRRAAAH